MGLIVEKPRHRCDLPAPNTHGVGTLWRCDGCGKLWELRMVFIGTSWRPASWFNRIKYRKEF